jgi:hypothetical protein
MDKKQGLIQQFGEINLIHLAALTLIPYYPEYDGFRKSKKQIHKTCSPIVYPNVLRLKTNHLLRGLRIDNLVGKMQRVSDKFNHGKLGKTTYIMIITVWTIFITFLIARHVFPERLSTFFAYEMHF